jgi:di/tricarboxylate transporter
MPGRANEWLVDLSQFDDDVVKHSTKHAAIMGLGAMVFFVFGCYKLSTDPRIDAATEDLTWKSYLTCFFTLMALSAMVKGGPPEGVLLVNTTCLLLFGIITHEQAWRGFRDENVLAIAVLFAVAKGVDNTMIVKEALQYLMGGNQPTCFAIFRMCIAVAAVSAILNNTPVVAMMIPFVVDWDRRTGDGSGLYASQLLIPLSFGSMLGGMCTLIGTSTNLILNGLLSTCVGEDAAFYVFDTFLVGGPVAFIGICYMTFMAPIVLPKNKLPKKAEDEKKKAEDDEPQEEGDERGEEKELGLVQRWILCKGADRLRPEKKIIAGVMICVMLGLSASKATSLLEAALITVSVFVFTNVLTVEEAFASINWEVIVTIVGSYGLSNALQDTNVTKKISDCIKLVGTGCDLRLMVVLFVTTVFLSSIVSNQATVILLFPVAKELSGCSQTAHEQLTETASCKFYHAESGNCCDVDQLKQICMLLMIGASCAFATPIGYQTNLMVFKAGQYTWGNYLQFGTPLAGLLGLVTVVLTPELMAGGCSKVFGSAVSTGDQLMLMVYVIVFVLVIPLAGPIHSCLGCMSRKLGLSSEPNNSLDELGMELGGVSSGHSDANSDANSEEPVEPGDVSAFTEPSGFRAAERLDASAVVMKKRTMIKTVV